MKFSLILENSWLKPSLLQSNRMLYVCIDGSRLPLTICFSFTGQLLIGPRYVYNYFQVNYHHPLKINRTQKITRTHPKFFFFFKLKFKMGSRNQPPLPLMCPQRSLQHSRQYLDINNLQTIPIFQHHMIFSFVIWLIMGQDINSLVPVIKLQNKNDEKEGNICA